MAKSDRKERGKSHHYHALDSLRGIAACMVMFQHSSLMLPEQARAQLPDWVTLNPLRIFLNGYAAVILFFVLSGYVLALPYVQGKKQPYIPFVIKRICRIYIPFFVAILLAALLYIFSSPAASDLGSNAFHAWWDGKILTLDTLLQHLAMAGTINQMWLDSPIWSLVHEMRVSIIFPLLVILCRNPFTALAMVFLICFGAPFWAMANGQDVSLDTSSTLAGTFLITLRYVPFFIIGILLARYNEAVRGWLKASPRGVLWGLVAVALVLMYLPTEIKDYPPGEVIAYHYVIGMILGCTGGFFIILARHIASIEKILNAAPLRWLGRISYSLYLVHLPIMLFLFRALLGLLPFPLILLCVYAVALSTATLFQIVIEAPSMRLGRHLAQEKTA